MLKSKKLFKLLDSEEDTKKDSNENPLESLIIKHDSNDFFEKLLNFLPTPEDELENMKKDEEILLNQINEIKEVIERIEFRLNEIKAHNLESNIYKQDPEHNSSLEEFQDLSSKKDYYTVLLESYEADYEYTNSQKKSLGYLIEDCEEGDDKFEEQLPELLSKTFTSTKKKMEDVNSVVKILENQSKKNKIEECVECGLQFRDAQGRKTMLKHFHLKGFEELKKYKPIICLECFKTFLSVNESLKDIEFEEEDFLDCSKELCKKGNKIYNSKIIINNPEILEKGKKFLDLENEEFIKNIRNEGKKYLFDSFF